MRTALVIVAVTAATARAEVIEVVELSRATPVLAAPRSDAEKLGVVKKATRVSVLTEIERASDSCARWLELAPKGWICASATTPTELAATTVTVPTLVDDDDAPIRATYGIVRKGSTAFASREDAAAGVGRALEGSNTVRARGSTTIDGKRYWITQRGELIDATRVYSIRPSAFKGVIVSGALPAWTHPRKPAATYAQAGGRKRGEIAARTQVTVLEEQGRFARIADGVWIAKQDLRVATLAAPPEGTAADERWFDIDLDAQILVAYEGTRPVYATLVSTGKYGHHTPTLVARIASKHEATPMTSDKGDVYSVADVPWTMFYDGNYALHTSYWHDGFGGPRSHGCINLAPRDARLLYAWSSPDVPAGWSSVYGSVQQPGSLVRVRTARTPAPAFRGYAKQLRGANRVALSE